MNREAESARDAAQLYWSVVAKPNAALANVDAKLESRNEKRLPNINIGLDCNIALGNVCDSDILRSF